MSRLLEQWRSLPRAARWLASFAAAVLAYFVIVEPALDWRAGASARADALEAALLRRADRAAGDSADAALLGLAASRFGAPSPPGGEERVRELNRRVEDIFSRHSVSNLTIRARAPVSLGRDALNGIVPEGLQAQRAALDIEFESSPETAVAVLTELESAPEVSAVGRVTLRRDERDGRKRVTVSVAPEAWLIAPARGGRP